MDITWSSQTRDLSRTKSESKRRKISGQKKVDRWLEQYCEAAIKNVLTFTNGSPDGYAKLYHENGKISEEGMYMWDTQVEN